MKSRFNSYGWKLCTGMTMSDNEWGFSNKMLDLTRHIDKVRKA